MGLASGLAATAHSSEASATAASVADDARDRLPRCALRAAKTRAVIPLTSPCDLVHRVYENT
jgi:hypothetical protein